MFPPINHKFNVSVYYKKNVNQIRDVQSLLSKNMNQNREVHRLGGGGGGGDR